MDNWHVMSVAWVSAAMLFGVGMLVLTTGQVPQ